MKNLKLQYRDLEMRVMRSLRELVEKSKTESKYCSEKALRVNVFGYKELVIISDRLTFLDSQGDHYSIYAEATLEDLIDILEKHN